MKPFEKYVWKVVRHWDGDYISLYVPRYSPYCLEYEIGRETRTPGSYIFVFRRKEQALEYQKIQWEAWRQTSVLLKCSYTGRRKMPRLYNGQMDIEIVKRFWDRVNSSRKKVAKKFNRIDDWPPGTIWVESVTPIEEIIGLTFYT